MSKRKYTVQDALICTNKFARIQQWSPEPSVNVERPRHLLVAMCVTGTHIVHRQAFLFYAKLILKGDSRYVTCAVHSVPWELYWNENTIHKCTPVTALLENLSLLFKLDQL